MTQPNAQSASKEPDNLDLDIWNQDWQEALQADPRLERNLPIKGVSLNLKACGPTLCSYLGLNHLTPQAEMFLQTLYLATGFTQVPSDESDQSPTYDWVNCYQWIMRKFNRIARVAGRRFDHSKANDLAVGEAQEFCITWLVDRTEAQECTDLQRRASLVGIAVLAMVFPGIRFRRKADLLRLAKCSLFKDLRGFIADIADGVCADSELRHIRGIIAAISSSSSAKPTTTKPKQKRQRLSTNMVWAAILIINNDPTLPIAAVAREIGVHRSTLSRSKVFLEKLDSLRENMQKRKDHRIEKENEEESVDD